MTTATDWEGLLNSGIAAYKRGDYKQAISVLKKLSRCPSRTYRTKAGMGLVRAYMAQKDWASAKALCKTMGKSSKPAVQQWAIDTLGKIEARSQQTPKTDTDNPNLSGFTPLKPLDSKPSDSKPSDSKLPTDKRRETQPEPAVSMFHYAYLNSEIDEKMPPHKSVETAPTKSAEADDSGYVWRNAGRLKQGRSLGKMKPQQIWFAQSFGAIALYTLLLLLVHYILLQYNSALSFINRWLPSWITQRLPFQYLPENYDYLGWRMIASLGILLIASPWLWDLALRFTASRQPFSTQKLRQHSAEAASLITQRCQKRRWPVPTLWKLSTDVPLLFSYGWLPRNARLVISEGLLSELSAEELATLVGYEMSHWQTVYWPLLSLQGLWLLALHQIYWQVALWGNRQDGPLRWLAGIASSVSYCIFWVMRLPGLWVNRVRTYYGDRTAVQLTGNPNAHARALTKLAFALASSTQQQGYTPPTVEQLALLLPVSMELTRSSLYGTLPLADLFAWDSQHPLRNWMSVMDEHPPLGDRLRLLMAYAKHWKLAPEISITATVSRRKGLSRQHWGDLIQQGTPFFGLLLGTSLGLGCLLIGSIGRWLEWPAIDWMYQDAGVFWFCPLMGLSLGTFLRMNRFFPDLLFGMMPSQDLPARLCDPALLPVDSLATKLSGTIIGRPGLANWLGQDLMLKTSEGAIKLHIFSTLETIIGPVNTRFFLAFGPFGNLLAQQDRPAHILGKSVQVLGWFRRGNHPWLDVDRMRLSNGRLIEGSHPTTSLLIAALTSTLALWLLGFGQFFQVVWDKV